MEAQPPYNPGYPQPQTSDQPQPGEGGQEQPVVIVGDPTYYQQQLEEQPAAEEPPNMCDALVSCGAACTKYKVDEALLTEPDRRKKFSACIMCSLVSQILLVWAVVFMLQCRQIHFGEKFEKWRDDMIHAIIEQRKKTGDHVHLERDWGSEAAVYLSMMFVPFVFYFLILIIVFRVLNCGRKAPANWIFAILGYILILGGSFCIGITVPFLNYVLVAPLGSCIIMLLSLLTCLDLLASPPWLGYMIALIASIFTATLSTLWCYLGHAVMQGSVGNVKDAEHLMRVMGAWPGVSIFGFSILSTLYLTHELRQVLHGRRLEVREDEACIISCVL